MILSVFICEDDHVQRKKMEDIITTHAERKNYNIKIVLSTGNPTEIIVHLKENLTQNSLYILDVDLQHEINGISLAREIREHDFSGTIVFVTTHVELSHMTFKYRVEAMDYIIKADNMVTDVCECVDLAYNRYSSALSENEYLQVKSTVGLQRIPIDKIIYIEANHAVSNKLTLYTLNDRVEFRGTLKDIEAVNPNFFRCNKSYIINTRNIKRVQRMQKVGEAEMKNGKIVPVGEPKIAALMKMMEEQ